ncbi:tight junction protein ZO-1-like isoform X2 [Hydractinia symbiolongicarpus]|uniref:tight junction protein ZO-1-like isoform X2 n=1 Tax=Hydractinia symbiolongicarpus TaxID=13093 RepID=UPI002551B303|nr:tight junction protein ZO-1-like isoform X2 [Hydractinia symbiolongicarpus]
MPAPTISTNTSMQHEDGWEVLTVVLEKSSARQGFGIAISGGKDNPHFKTGDVSIIVSDIVEGSAADGVLRAGDKLISVNERLVHGGTHHDAVQALKAAGMQARMEIKRPVPYKSKSKDRNEHLNPADSSTPKGSPKTEERGRERKKPKEMDKEHGERHRSSRSRSRGREGENGEPRRSRSRSKGREGEDGEKRRSRSKNREEGENGEKPRRSHSRHREEGEEGKERPKRPGRSKSRSRDDLTRSKSKESLHRSKSKSKENLNGLPPNAETHTIVLERGNQGYGFSLGQQIFIRDLAKESPAAKAENLDKGDILHELNGTPVANLKISECIDIIKTATEQLTLTIIKKPKESSKDVTDSKTKSAKPTRPIEAPEARGNLGRGKNKHEEKTEEKHKEETPHENVKERPRQPTPPSEPLNETNGSWSQSSPTKQYSTDDARPSDEIETMDLKLERLKPGMKFERRLSMLPNARVISFHKTGSVGIQVAGGNNVGIFVAAIRPDSAAAKEGLKPGDQIIMCNEIDFEDITREEAVLILLALPDDVSLVVESKKDTFDKIKKDLGDNFFIRVNFDHADKSSSNELMFRKGEIFNVRDTMYQGLIGYWQAQKVGRSGQMLERGILPNKSRAEQLAIAQKMEERQATLPGRKLKRKGSIGGTLKRQKFVSQDRLDESSFAEGVQIPAYERVVLKIADFMRPVVILGGLADLVRLYLLDDLPDRFDVPTPLDVGGSRPYDDSIKLSEIRNVITKNKHCLLDTTPEGIEMLMYAQLCPIVVLLKSPSRGAVREMRESLVNLLKNSPSPSRPPGFNGDPLSSKQVKRVFSNAKKLEEFYPHIFTAKINTHVQGQDIHQHEFYHKLKDIIFNQQAQSAWMPEEKPADFLDDMVFHPINIDGIGNDTDTEGESTTSSPVLARKHYEEESPLPSPTEHSAFAPPVVETTEPKKHYHEKSKDRKHRDREGSSDREHRRSRHDRRDKHDKHEEDAPPSFKPEEPPRRYEVHDYREPPRRDLDDSRDYQDDSRDYRDGRDYREEKRGLPDNSRNYQDESRREDSRNYREDGRNYREDSRDYREDSRDYREDSGDYRDDSRDYQDDSYRDYRNDYKEPPRHGQESPRDYGAPSVNREIKRTVEEHVSVAYETKVHAVPHNETTDFMYGSGPQEPGEDLPVLMDPNYEMPKIIPDSPPSREAPEVKPKPSSNAIRVFPNELKNEFSMEEKRRSLKKIPDYNDNPLKDYDERAGVKVSDVWNIERTNSPKRSYQEQDDLPPYRPPPPAQEEVPTKVMTLQERMSKFQQKVTAQPKKQPPPVDDDAPPARPAAPRNYIIDTRRGAQKQDQYAQNSYRPSAQFAEVTRITPRAKPIEEPYVNIRETSNVHSAPDSRYAGYDYVNPKQHARSPSPDNHTYDYPRPPRDDYRTAQDDPHYRHPPPSREDEPIVIATARGMFDHRGGLLESAETNVSIYIPAGALPEGRKQEVYFKVCQDSKYMPPLDSRSGETLLSPLVMCGPHGLKFRKPIELRLPHKGASNDSMAFSLKSSDSPVGHPGHWKNVKLGGKDLDSGRAYQVTDDTVSVLVDHF